MKQDLVLIVPDGHPLADQYRIPLSETLAYPYSILIRVPVSAM